MIAWSFASRCTSGRLRKSRFLIVFDLRPLVMGLRTHCVLRTFVTVVPARKNAASKMKKAPHGCIACTTAVAKAVAMPKGVKDLWDQARYTSAAISGAAISGFMVDAGMLFRSSVVLKLGSRLTSRVSGRPNAHLSTTSPSPWHQPRPTPSRSF